MEETARWVDRSTSALSGLRSKTETLKERTAKVYEAHSGGANTADGARANPNAERQIKTLLDHTTTVEKNATDLLNSVNSLKSDVIAFQSIRRNKSYATLDGDFSTFEAALSGISDEVQSMIQSGQITDQEIQKAINEAMQKSAEIKMRIINSHSTDVTFADQSASDFELLGSSLDDLGSRVEANTEHDKAAQSKLNASLDSAMQNMASLQAKVAELTNQNGSMTSGEAVGTVAFAEYSQRFADAARDVRLAERELGKSMNDMQNSVAELQKLSPSGETEDLRELALEVQEVHRVSSKELKSLADAFDTLAHEFN